MVSIGATFVITAGGIDLSVGSVLGLATVWATTLATQSMAADLHWIVMVFTAVAVGAAAGLINGVIIAYGKVVSFIATLAMLIAARGLAEIISGRRTQLVSDSGFKQFFSGSVLGVPTIVWIFIVVAALGWLLLNRTTFGRRTVAVGGNAEAARLAGINVKRHIVYVFTLCGLTAGIAAVMMMGRTDAGSSTNGMLYELDAIAAVVVGGTLLIGGRGTIIGTVFGVLIFQTLMNIFVSTTFHLCESLSRARSSCSRSSCNNGSHCVPNPLDPPRHREEASTNQPRILMTASTTLRRRVIAPFAVLASAVMHPVHPTPGHAR